MQQQNLWQMLTGTHPHGLQFPINPGSLIWEIPNSLQTTSKENITKIPEFSANETTVLHDEMHTLGPLVVYSHGGKCNALIAVFT